MNTHPTTDEEAWLAYTSLRHLFNKLDLALRLGYSAGPSLVPVPKTADYIVRPIYNLGGMGSYAHIKEIKQGNTVNIPGSFWCEAFEGRHICVEYAKHKGELYVQKITEGFRRSKDLFRFDRWVVLDKLPTDIKLPPWLEQDLASAYHSNVEFIGGKVTEVHLRKIPDFPKGAKEIIPIWSDEDLQQAHLTWSEAGYTWQVDEDDNDGTIPVKRLGFYYR